MNKILKTSIAILIAFNLQNLKAEETNNWNNAPILLKGSIESSAPTISINSPDSSISLIESFSASISGQTNDCPLIFNESEIKDERTYCLIEINKIPEGLVFNNGFLNGTFENKNDNLISFNLFITNNSGYKELIDVIEKTINVSEPELPVINKVELVLDDIVTAYNGELITKKPQKYQLKTTTKENYPYKQSVYFNNEKKCNIGENQSSCTAVLNTINSIEGSELISVKSMVNSKLYSESVNFNINWNYKPMIISGYSVNINDIVTNNGLTENNLNSVTALIKKEPLKLNIPTSSIDASKSYLLLDGKKIQAKSIQENNSEYVAIFDLSNIISGKYNGKIIINDIDGNESQVNINDILLDYNKPIIKAYNNGNIINETNISSYDLSNIYFEIYDESIFSIKSFKINNSPDSLSLIDNKYYVSNNSIDYTSLPESNIELIVIDSFNNEQKYELSIRHDSGNIKDLSKNIYTKTVENVTETILLQGFDCSNFDNFTNINTSDSQCFIEFVNFNGLNPQISKNNILLNGFFAEKLVPEVNVYYKNNNNVVKIKNKKFNIEIVEPLLPELSIISKATKKEDTYLVNGNMIKLGTLVSKIQGDVIVYINGDSLLNINESVQKPNSGIIKTDLFINNNSKLFEEKNSIIKVAYKNDESLFSEINLNTIKTLNPESVNMEAELRDDVVINTEDAVINVYFGKNEGSKSTSLTRDKSNEGWSYNPDEHGTWDIYLAEKIGQEFIPLTNKEKSSVLNSFNINTANKTNILLYPIAETEINGIKQYKYGSPIKLNIMEGGEIKTTIASKRMNTTILNEFIAKLDLIYPSLIYKKSTSEVHWFVKTPSEQDYKLIENTKNANRIYFRMMERGDYFFKLKTINRFTGEESYSQEHIVLNYQTPEIIINTPTYHLIGVNGNATVDIINQFNSEDVDFEFSLDKGITWNQGKEFNFIKNEKGTIQLLTRAKLKQTPGQYENAWGYAKKDIVFVEHKPNNVKLNTDKAIAIIGESLSININVRPWYSEMDNSQIKGILKLNNGQEFKLVGGDNNIVIENVTPEMIVNNKILLTIESSFGEYEKTHREIKYAMKYFEYKWPEFSVILKQPQKTAPSSASISIIPSDSNFKYFEGISIKWDIPSNIEALKESDLFRNITLPHPGDYIISVEISDNKGNKTVKEINLKAYLMEPLELSVSSSFKPIMNEPAYANFRVNSISGGRSDDSVIGYEWYLNDNKLSYDKYNLNLTGLTKGSYNLKLKAITKLNNEGTFETNFTVSENKKPECEIKTLDSSKTFSLNAICKDTDGKIIAFKWFDEKGAIYSKKNGFALLKTKKTFIKDLKLEVYDDSNEFSIFNIGDVNIENNVVTITGTGVE